MQLYKTNADGSDPQIEEIPPQSSVEATIEYGRAASEGGRVALMGGDFNTQPPPPEPKPGDPPPAPYYPAILAVFNNGAQIVCYYA